MDRSTVIERADLIPSEAGYYRSELEALFDAVTLLKPWSSILEVGCCYGRSASVLAQVAKESSHQLTFVDPFSDNESVLQKFVLEMWRIGAPFTLHMMRSDQCKVVEIFDFIHIDGDHSIYGVTFDCEHWLPQLKRGGIVAFHDYGTISAVTKTVDEYLKNWTPISWTDRLIIWRKPS